MDKVQILQSLREQRDYLAHEFGVSALGLFGSFAKDQANAASDIDLLVEFERPIGLRFVELADYLESVLGRKVDVLTPAGLKAIHREAVLKSIKESVIHV